MSLEALYESVSVESSEMCRIRVSNQGPPATRSSTLRRSGKRKMMTFAGQEKHTKVKSLVTSVHSSKG
jgi:hypothetical protein